MRKREGRIFTKLISSQARKKQYLLYCYSNKDLKFININWAWNYQMKATEKILHSFPSKVKKNIPLLLDSLQSVYAVSI